MDFVTIGQIPAYFTPVSNHNAKLSSWAAKLIRLL